MGLGGHRGLPGNGAPGALCAGGPSPRPWQRGNHSHCGQGGRSGPGLGVAGLLPRLLPDGSPRHTEEVAARRGFSVRVSKLGLFSDCLYLMPEDQRECWTVGETEVTLGYRSMSYGPYDPETHQPSGYYDLYVAEFTLEGLDWQIVFEQLPLEEVVKVTAGVITGEEEITVLPGPLEHAPRK